MKVLRADAMGVCFGVRDALALAHQIERPESVTIHGQLVHNETVLVQLQSRGFRLTHQESQRPLPQTPEVLITAHGVSDRERHRLQKAGKQLIDTTCPLVRKVHAAAQALHNSGFHVLIIGRPGHVEVQGIVEDLSDYDVIDKPEIVNRYVHERLGIICQSTTPPRLAEQIHAAIVRHNPHAEIRFVDTVCQPTRDRQQAVERLIPLVDAMVVVGGRNSNNSCELAELCRSRGVLSFHVQNAGEIDPDWFAGCHCVGLTAGTSTLDETIQDVYESLAQL